MRLFFLILTAFLTLACSEAPKNANSVSVNSVNKSNVNSANTVSAKIPEYTYEIVKPYPHDPQAFTQGLVVHNGFFYEGTGGTNGDLFFSSIRKVEINTGKVLQKFDLSRDYFGEGITIFNDRIYQLTWKNNKAFVYDLNDFSLIKELKYPGEGWGLTHDGENLIMSDGTQIIRFVNPETFETLRTIAVFDEKGRPLEELNELEYVKGEIWANVWQEGKILRIDPANGKLLGVINLEKLADLVMDNEKNSDVLNGIAYDASGDRIFITGKKWGKIYEIKVVPKS